MRNLPVRSGLVLAAAFAVAACGGSSTPTAATVPTIPPINLPSIPAIPTIPPIPSIPALGSFALPSFPGGLPSFAIPSFTTDADPALAAMFPTTIGGQPVTAVMTYSLAEFLAFESQTDPTFAQQETAALTNAGVNPATVTIGTGDVTLNEDDITISAFHAPGAQASNLIQALVAISQANNSDASPPTITQATVGGKSVTKVIDSDGDVGYVVTNNDILWSVDGATTDDEAATVLQALP